MKKIFISHASTDPNFIKANTHILRYYLLNSLKDFDIDVILDDTHMGYGTNMDNFMFSEIENSFCAICICTPDYFIRSRVPDSGVSKELKHIMDMQLKNPNFVIIPLIFLGTTDTSIPQCLSPIFAPDHNDFLIDIKRHLYSLKSIVDSLTALLKGLTATKQVLVLDNIEDDKLNEAEYLADKFVTDISLIDLNPEIVRESYQNGNYDFNYEPKDYQIVFKISNISNLPLKVEFIGLKDIYGSKVELTDLNVILSNLCVLNPSDFPSETAIVTFDLLKFNDIPNYFTALKNPSEGYSKGYSFDIEYKINEIYFKNNLRTEA